MNHREILLAELGRECVRPVPPPPLPTDEQRRKQASWDRLEEFMRKWEIR